MMKILLHTLDPVECDILAKKIQSYEKPVGDNLVPNSFSAYALPETEELLLKLTPKICDIVGKELYPTYSYSRMYYPGASMPPHTDRNACEISMSLCISGEPWPLWFQLDRPTSAFLNPGDAVVYQGIEVTHWRDVYAGAGCTCVFLHWVDASGPYADWRYDRRPSIGSKETDKLYWGKS
jgi:hypothetical protein